MPLALAILLACQMAGEGLRRLFHIPMPGPLIGMFLLAVVLAARSRNRPDPAPAALGQASTLLIANMGLLFVPAGLGVIVQWPLLKQAWFPILAGLVVSTVLGLAVTGLVMHHASRLFDGRGNRAAG